MEATPELRALLCHRRRIVEEGTSGISSPSPTPSRLPSQRAGAGSLRRCCNSVRGEGRVALAQSLRGQLARTLTSRISSYSAEMKLKSLSERNEQLTREVEKMQGPPREERAAFAEERERLLVQTEELLATGEWMAFQKDQYLRLREELQAEADEVDRRAAGVEHLNAEVEALRHQNRELLRANAELQAAHAEVPTHTPSASCSGCRLRAAMTSNCTAPDELRQAIGAAEALLDEARRELAGKQLRARRAGLEMLHAAMAQGQDEAALAAAIGAAQAAGVDAEDIGKAEARLAELRALSPQQRAERAGRELEAKRKKDAFLLVKKDDADALTAFLDSLEEGVRWQDWRDYAGRTMARCARELHSSRALEVLASRDSPPKAAEPPAMNPWQHNKSNPSPFRPADVACSGSEGSQASTEASTTAPRSPFGRAPVPPASPRSATPPRPRPLLPIALGGAAAAGEQAQAALGTPRDAEAAAEEPAAATSPAAAAGPPLSAEDEEKLRAKAFRAVVQDDCAALAGVLAEAPLEVWSRWENRAGKDLLTLSQERGSASAYSVLAKALGMLRELKREAFEERETVWVFVNGDVQPRRATVLEETGEEAEVIHIEYWDGDSPPAHVERCSVRKMWS